MRPVPERLGRMSVIRLEGKKRVLLPEFASGVELDLLAKTDEGELYHCASFISDEQLKTAKFDISDFKMEEMYEAMKRA